MLIKDYLKVQNILLGQNDYAYSNSDYKSF